ncbi:MAG: TniQ family protein [Ferrovibrio sp.]|uniref:TniQ family protein n=1 Tax=Ferrovibrio sp. TaxID=1917215 RepID=UPI00262F2F66|nr:TniQ family protein [Ferrovibrio sp.]MCW0236298.1 TniQ family protein [Ferrovibrio sp.]
MSKHSAIADIRPLNTTFPPKADESIFGYLARLAEANDSRVGEVADRADIKLKKSNFTDADVKRIAAISRQSFEKLRPLAPEVNSEASFVLGCNLDNLGVLIKTRRVCPKCIKGEHGYYKAVWDWKFVQHCQEHKLRLLTQCLDCGKHLDWRTKSIRHCTCGTDLTKVKVEKAEAADLHAIKAMLAIAFSDKKAIPPLLKGFDTYWAWLALCDFACLSLKTRKQIWPGATDPGLKATYGGDLKKHFTPVEQLPPRENARRMSLGAVALALVPEKLEQALVSELRHLDAIGWPKGTMDLYWYRRIKWDDEHDNTPLVKLVDRAKEKAGVKLKMLPVTFGGGRE